MPSLRALVKARRLILVEDYSSETDRYIVRLYTRTRPQHALTASGETPAQAAQAATRKVLAQQFGMSHG